MLVGHTSTVRALEADLPPVSLLVGPKSVGKRTLSEHLVQRSGATKADQQVLKDLTVDKARELKRFLATRPFGPCKTAMLNLDGAHPAALNALLKLLEEPPSRVHIVLRSSQQVLLTVRSRARTFPMGFLSDAEVASVLTQKFKFSQEEAASAASMSGGQVAKALEAVTVSQAKAPVLSALKATADGNEALLHNALQKWGRTEHALLATWATEAVTGCWRTFSREESFGLANDRVLPQRVLRSMRTGARPKIAARLALSDILEGNR